MANYIRTTFLVPPSPGDVAVLFRNKQGQITFEVFVKSISAIWQDSSTVKIKTHSADKALVLDFSTPQEALVALQYANNAIEVIRANLPSSTIDQSIVDYINLRISQTYFEFHQITATTSWTIPHTLNARPNVSITDNSFIEIEGLTRWLTPTLILVQFNQPVSGWAFLS